MKFLSNRYIIMLCALAIMLGIASCSENKNSTGSTYTVTIHINYQESSGFNYRDDAKLFVDDVEVADVPYGSQDDYEIVLVEGVHAIYLKRDALFRKTSTNTIEIDVSKDNTYISITAKENTISGLSISEDTSSESAAFFNGYTLCICKY